MKRALLVGIDYYEDFPPLHGCANDVRALLPLLARNEDGTVNLDCRDVVATDAASALTRDEFLDLLTDLLSPSAEFALLYFAGHGAEANGDVVLATTNGTNQTPGVKFADVLEMINGSSIPEVAVILDCCYSGGASTLGALMGGLAHLRRGVSILSASRHDQTSAESHAGRGEFSEYLEAALAGGAADVLGHINVAGLYAYISESFGAWEQRPTFKANVDGLHDLRRADARVPHAILMKLTEWFTTSTHVFPLDPSFEPEAEPHHPENEAIFADLQRLRANRLVEPVGAEHLYFAAMTSTGVRLTPLGRHYWQMVRDARL